ncbi:hypothetical protein JI58_05810 [Marinosulfonomonas sp. PRT-SC04]|nr:hypothetical protein JI58_05810 [Marinosulfonomonas sp. PRT-SC04]
MKNCIKIGCLVSLAVVLAGCDGSFSAGAGFNGNRVDVAGEATDPGARPAARPDTGVAKPVKTARTVEQFDTTTVAQRSKAAAPTSGGRKLGATVGSLGNPTEPGFWLKTPLVTVAGKGRVEYPANGKSVAVDLIPIDGPKTAGSRVSLAALRLLGAPLTGLPELVVYAE